MAEAFDTRELGKALDEAEGDSAAPAAQPPSTSTPPPIDVLSNDVLVSVFVALEDQTWVRRTIPLVCRAWAELYRTKDASPLHETLHISFASEVEKAVEAGSRGAPSLLHGSRVISWAERRAGSVHKLLIGDMEDGANKDFSFKEMGRLVAVTAPSLDELVFNFELYVHSQVRGELRRRRGGHYVLPDLKPFWKAVRDSVAPAGRLRSLDVRAADFSESDLEPLKKLAGSLKELVLSVWLFESPKFPRPGDPGIPRRGIGLPRFPELLCDLAELRMLWLGFHRKIEALPAKISSLKKLKELYLPGCRLFSLPEELGELSGLEKLYLGGNEKLGTTLPKAFPAELGKMKSLRELNLSSCGLRTVPAFIGELKSLEGLNLNDNKNLGDAPQHEAFPAALANLESLRGLYLERCNLRGVPAVVGELKSLEALGLSGNQALGDAPQQRAFPAALGRMKSLRGLFLKGCGLRTLPAFVSKLESLEGLELSENDFEVDAAALDALLKRCRSLCKVDLSKSARPWTARSLANLAVFKARLLAENPEAKVRY